MERNNVLIYIFYVSGARNIFKFMDRSTEKLNVRGQDKCVKSRKGIDIDIYDGK